MSATDQRLTQLLTWIRRTTDVPGCPGLLVPVSGGSDSALCFWLCARALPPGRAVAAFAGFGLRCRDWFEGLGPVRFLPGPPPDAHPEATRWAAILALALGGGGWLVGSRNRTEDLLGTYSLASRVATYLPLAGLWKSEVMELAAAVGVPAEVLASSRRADPECGRPQEMAEIPFETVDVFLQVRIGERPESDLAGLPAGAIAYLEPVYRRNRFKTGLPLRGPNRVGARPDPRSSPGHEGNRVTNQPNKALQRTAALRATSLRSRFHRAAAAEL
jgi:NH3-dependent NAD+ synthetase